MKGKEEKEQISQITVQMSEENQGNFPEFNRRVSDMRVQIPTEMSSLAIS